MIHLSLSRKVSAALALVLFGLLGAVLIGEGAVRLANLEPGSLWVFNGSYGWSYGHGLRLWYTTRDFRNWVETNSRGLHEREISYDKPGGLVRILVLGDSFTGALEVPLEAAYPKVLERMLNSSQGGTRVQVINAGIGGFSTVNEYLLFLHEGQKYRADLVLLAFEFSTDIIDNYPPLASNVTPGAPYAVLENERLEFRRYPVSLRTHIERTAGRLRLFRLAYRAYATNKSLLNRWAGDLLPSAAATSAESVPPMYALYQKPLRQEYRQAWQVTLALLRRLHDAVREARASLVVVSLHQMTPEMLREALDRYPEFRSLEWDLDQPDRLLREALARGGVPYLSLSPTFRQVALRTGATLEFPHDHHWTADGHRLAATEIARFLTHQPHLRSLLTLGAE